MTKTGHWYLIPKNIKELKIVPNLVIKKFLGKKRYGVMTDIKVLK